MSDPFLAEIRVFGSPFPPKGWAFCDGQLMQISQNTALFALLGTVYGGDGKTTFALPDLRDHSLIGPGEGRGLSEYAHGASFGSSTVSLLQSEIPFHTHAPSASSDPGELQSPAPDRALARSSPGFAYRSGTTTDADLAPLALAPAGGDWPHNNRQPVLGLNFCIALQGVFPQRP
jgi:microcystin-dependent protein